MFDFRKPAWWLLLLLLVAECAFLAAARWQWHRGQFKDQRAREFAVALADLGQAPARDFASLADETADFSAAHLRGRLRSERVLLLDNRIVLGQYGVDVFVPLALDGGGFVMVNLGWIRADPSRRIAPELPEFDVALASGGLLAPAPAAGLAVDVATDAVPGAPQMRLSILPHAISADLKLSPMLDRVFLPAPVAGGPFVRDWKPTGMTGDRHRGYALQWASFAVACLVLFLLFHVRRKETPR